MKRSRFWPFAILSFFFALLMLLFTFLNVLWTSGAGGGISLSFAVPLADRSNALDTLIDLMWLSAPFALLLSLLLSLAGKEKAFSPVSSILSAFPLFLYGVCKLFSFLGGKESHFSVMVTLIFLLLTASLNLYSSFHEELRLFAAQLYLIHGVVESVLLILSFSFQEKISQFYFSQYRFTSGHSTYRFRFFVISVFLYYLFYCLSLFFRLAAGRPPEKKEKPAPPPERVAEEEEEEEENIPLSLEDFGIEK